MHRQGRNGRRQPQHQGHVGDIRSDGIADGQPGIALQSRHGGNQHFRRGGAESHDGQTDDQGGHSQGPGQARGTGHETVRAPHEHHQAAGHGENIQKHIAHILLNTG